MVLLTSSPRSTMSLRRRRKRRKEHKSMNEVESIVNEESTMNQSEVEKELPEVDIIIEGKGSQQVVEGQRQQRKEEDCCSSSKTARSSSSRGENGNSSMEKHQLKITITNTNGGSRRSSRRSNNNSNSKSNSPAQKMASSSSSSTPHSKSKPHHYSSASPHNNNPEVLVSPERTSSTATSAVSLQHEGAQHEIEEPPAAATTTTTRMIIAPSYSLEYPITSGGAAEAVLLSSATVSPTTTTVAGAGAASNNNKDAALPVAAPPPPGTSNSSTQQQPASTTTSSTSSNTRRRRRRGLSLTKRLPRLLLFQSTPRNKQQQQQAQEVREEMPKEGGGGGLIYEQEDTDGAEVTSKSAPPQNTTKPAIAASSGRGRGRSRSRSSRFGRRRKRNNTPRASTPVNLATAASPVIADGDDGGIDREELEDKMKEEGIAAAAADDDDDEARDTMNASTTPLARLGRTMFGSIPAGIKNSIRRRRKRRLSAPPSPSAENSCDAEEEVEEDGNSHFRRSLGRVPTMMRNTRILTLQRPAISCSRSSSSSASTTSDVESNPTSNTNDTEAALGNNTSRGRATISAGACESATAILLCGIGGGHGRCHQRSLYDECDEIVDVADDYLVPYDDTTGPTSSLGLGSSSVRGTMNTGSGGATTGSLSASTNNTTSACPRHQQQQQQPSRRGGKQQRRNRKRLPDDPTVQESIECIFASQLEEGISLFGDDDDAIDSTAVSHGDDDDDYHLQPLVAPSVLQQSILKNRSEDGRHSNSPGKSSMRKVREEDSFDDHDEEEDLDEVSCLRGRFVHIGTYDPKADLHDLEEQQQLALETGNADCHQPFVRASSVMTTATAPTACACQRAAAAAAAALVGSSSHHHHRKPQQQQQSLPTTDSLLTHHPQAPPLLDPEHWPQRPLLLRPSRGTRIIGVRFSRSQPNNYLWKPSDGHNNSSWLLALKRHWRTKRSLQRSNEDNIPTSTTTSPRRTKIHTTSKKASASNNDDNDTVATVMSQMPWCAQCGILPVNNGNEPKGEALVTDFETDLFRGTLLVRLRHSQGSTPEPYNDEIGYFAGMNRRYQAVVRGRFKESVPFTTLLTGFQLDRPCGKLPPKWIIKSALQVVRFFAPQLDVQLEGSRPSSLTPLGSTPQCIVVNDASDESKLPSMEDWNREPTDPKQCLLGRVQESTSASSLQRARVRKRYFDKLFTMRDRELKADPNKIYTFEFLQHLFDFERMSLELGSLIGSMPLHEILNGQPLQIMALQRPNEDNKDECRYLWAFDIWHQVVMDDAIRNAAAANVNNNPDPATS